MVATAPGGRPYADLGAKPVSSNPHKADAGPGSGTERSRRCGRYGLAPIPTTLRRLVYLTSLRDEKTGRYDGSKLAELCGAADADLVLREIHEDVFGTLSFSLGDQHEELKDHLELLRREDAAGNRSVVDFGPWKASPYSYCTFQEPNSKSLTNLYTY